MSGILGGQRLSSAGRLTDITQHVFCHPSTVRTGDGGVGDDDALTASSRPACPTAMRRAPLRVVEDFPAAGVDNDPLRLFAADRLADAAGGLGMRMNWADQLVLAYPDDGVANAGGKASTIAPSIYGPVNDPAGSSGWAWRDWRGPTVRRWMLGGFRIHVARQWLRKINSWKVPLASVLQPTDGQSDYIRKQNERYEFGFDV